MPVEVGVGYVSIVPEMSRFGPELDRQMSRQQGRLQTAVTQAMADAGGPAGEQAGQGVLGGLGGALKGGMAAVAVAGAALFAKAFSDTLEQDKGNDKLAAQLGLSEKESARIGKVAGSVYAKGYGESVEQVNESLKSLAQNGVAAVNAPKKDLAALSKSALNLAETFDADVGESAKAAGQLIRTGLAKNGKEAFDLLTAGFQSGADKAGDLIDTVNEYGTQWRKAGLTGAQGIGLINQALQAGARDGDVAADAIKEFTIRAIDGSKTSAAGFQLLGLNADDMASKFAKGGKSANGVLDLTLDKLRGIKDPVKQSQAAVALFGTQAEDLGDALFAMDPSTAAAGLGKVGGAAEKMGNTLHDNASSKIEAFKRTAMQGLVTFIGGYVLPPLERLGGVLVRTVGPAFDKTRKFVGGLFSTIGGDDTLGPFTSALSTAGSTVRDTLGPAFGMFAGSVRETLLPALSGLWSTISEKLVPAMSGAFGTSLQVTWGLLSKLGAVLIGTVWPAGMKVYSALADNLRPIIASVSDFIQQRAVPAAQMLGERLGSLVTRAQPVIAVVATVGAFLGRLAANVLGVVIPALVRFAGPVFSVVASVLGGALGLLGGVIGAVVAFGRGVGAAATTVGAAFSWLWSTVLSPVFSAIGTAARILATVVAVVMVGPIMVGLKALGAVASWLYRSAIQPAFDGIGAAASWLNKAAIKPAIAGASAAFRALGAAGSWLYRSAIQPAVNGIGSAVSWLNRNAVKPAFDGIRSTISAAYNVGIKPVFDRLKSATGSVAGAFDTARAGIKKSWDRVKGIAKGPVEFIVETVYNGGIVKTWNRVADVFGAPTLSPIKGFARGGVLPGQSSYRNGDDQLVPMRRGEGVYVSEAMKDPYERARLSAVNRAAMQGQNLSQYQGGFAKGGIFGWVGSAASKGVDLAKSGVSWLKDGIKDSAVAGLNSVVRPLIARISGSQSVYRDMISGIPEKMIKTIVSFSGAADKKMSALGIGGKGYKAALSWARTQNGKKYQWGGNGNPSWDCSGLVSAIESVIRGQKPHRRWATGSFSGATAPPGWVRGKASPYRIGITNSGVGHTAGTINGTNVESRGGDGVVIGSGARGYNSPLFSDWYGFTGKGYATGGRPKAGELAWVGERGPELVRFGSGNSQVYDNRTSLDMAAGVGARGFAKGTSGSASKARREVPGDLKSFTKSLTGSASAIAKASKNLSADLKSAGGAGKSLASSVSKTSTKLQQLAKERDAVGSKYAAAKTAASDQKKNAADYLGLSNISAPTSVGDLITGLQSRQAALKLHEKQISTASKKGVDQRLISQLVAAGPDSPLAGLVSGASAVQIKQLNALAKSGATLSTSYGNAMSDAMYDAGKNAGKGFLTGLQSQEKELQKQMAKLGGVLVDTIEKRLDIHSPARETERIGRMVGAGVVVGTRKSLPQVRAEASRLAVAALPAVQPVNTGQQSGALQRGDTLVLRIGEREFVAVVDERVDQGFDDARQRGRAGSKKR